MPITTTIPALSTPPSRSDPTNFASRGDTFLGELPGWGTDVNTVGTEINSTVAAINASTSAAAASAVSAASSASIALASANFKGEWSSLTGALNKPASVKNNGRFWLLLNNLADVTTSEPGVSADWTALDAGTDITQIITITTAASTGVTYLFNADSIELDLPTSGLLKGDFVGVVLLAAPGTQTIDTGGAKVNKLTMDANKILLDKPSVSFSLVYEDPTVGFWIK